MTKARDLANLISTGNPLSDGALAASEVSGLHAVATSGAYANLTGKPTLATVATSGAYADVTGTPSLATVATSGAYSDLSGSPSGDSLLPSQSGNTGKFLTSNGSAASWADAGGGAYELIQKTTISSNVSTITFTSISAPQEQLLLIFNGLKADSNNWHLHLRFLDSSGNNMTSTNYYQYGSQRFGYEDNGGGGQTQSSIKLTHNSSACYYHTVTSLQGHYNIYGFGTDKPFLRGVAVYPNSGDETIGNHIAARCDSAPASSGGTTSAQIQLFLSNGASNFTSGSVYLYKLV